jgi:hypothetical protein
MNTLRLTHHRVATLCLGAAIASLLLSTLDVGASPTSSLSITPTSAAPGVGVTASGARFPKQTAVVLSWDGSTSGMPTTSTSASGSFKVQLTVPSTATVGSHTLQAAAGGVSSTTTFQVISATPTTAATATATPPTTAATATATPTTVATATPTTAATLATPTTTNTQTPLRLVNVPYFSTSVDPAQAGIFWFGQVTPTTNYADVRLGYTSTELYVNVAIIDNRLWYQSGLTSQSTSITSWDSTSLYVNLSGNTGSSPPTGSYRFDAELNSWESSRLPYQASFHGTGTGWGQSNTAFTSQAGWRGSNVNCDCDARGWWVTYHIPFTSLGLSGPPPQGTSWGLGVSLHDRDDAAGTPISDQIWPTAMNPTSPSTWGQLAFGLPSYHTTAVASGSATIRQGLNGLTVPDGQVGGFSTCGGLVDPNFFQSWGSLNYAGYDQMNVMNEADIADWPCFSKYYVTFPLGAVPSGKAIVSAQLTLHQFGNAGVTAYVDAFPSLIQVLTVDQDIDPATLTWNNAPPARENIGQTWVNPLTSAVAWPGIAIQWDVSRAVAQAYATGQPVRLALYTADTNYSGGKYFSTSEVGDWDAVGRPTLQVTWGN